MLALPRRHGASAWYGALEEALKKTLKDQLDEISKLIPSCRAAKSLTPEFSLPREQGHTRAHDIVSQVLSVTQSALSTFASAWNEIQRDPVTALPTELTSACFRLLDLKDRIAVSHVSWSWRNAALSERRLWNAYTVLRGCANAGSGLLALLSRSDPAPFRLICFSDISDTLVDLVAANMHRFQLLRLRTGRRDAVLRLMAHDAPVLEEFRYHSPEGDAPMQLSWTGSHAPCLIKVEIGEFLLPTDGGAFRALRVFWGTLPEGSYLPAPLASIFPELTDLSLGGVTQASITTLSPLPRSLKVVSLASGSDEPINYAGFLRQCHTVNLSYLFLDSASSVSDVVSLLLRTPDRSWGLHFMHVKYLMLGTAEADYEIACHDHIRLLHEPGIMSHLNRLGHLILPLREYSELYRATTWTRALPALMQLSLRTTFPGGLERAHDMFDIAPIQAQVLESLEVRIDLDDPDESGLPMTLPYVAAVARSLAAPRLGEIVLYVEDADALIRADVSCLNGLARRISVRGFDAAKPVTILECS
ncbi:hypothetical protein AURDEDRAFT_168110 [Auricularia subglabra TFB-10046 SS5]|nr:hypothetical protein AURDEDRAFT_168110 [Auricularia subglabra TFB-10046 SS5]